MNTNTNIEITNATPHPVSILINGVYETIQPNRDIQLPSLSENVVSRKTINGITFCQVERQLPQNVNTIIPHRDNHIYIVSAMFRQAFLNQFPFRNDVCSPYELVRDENGNIVGANALEF